MVTYKEIKDFPGYRVGDDGTVWSCVKNRWGMTAEWHQLTPGENNVTPGYTRQIMRMGRGAPVRYVHHLVLEAFVGPRPPGKEACHKDGDATNNRLDNLYWGTRAENLADKKRHQRHYNTKLVPAQIVAIRQALAADISLDLIARLCDVSQTTISNIGREIHYNHIVSP